MKNACLLVHCISSFEGIYFFIKEYKIYTASLPVPLFFVLHHIRIYISRYNFYSFLEPNPPLTKKDFCHEFPFFNGLTKPPTPLTAKIC